MMISVYVCVFNDVLKAFSPDHSPTGIFHGMKQDPAVHKNAKEGVSGRVRTVHQDREGEKNPREFFKRRALLCTRSGCRAIPWQAHLFTVGGADKSRG
jgi:hypothetical protein